MSKASGNDNGEKVTARQTRAIVELLQTGSPAKAAKVAGVTPKTIHAWKRQPAFAAAMAAAEAEALAELSLIITRLGAKAAHTLYLAMDYDERAPGARVSAARAVLDNLIKYRELCDLEPRLAALEAAIFEKGLTQ